MDLSKLTRNQQISLVGGVGAILSIFLPWYGSARLTRNAFDSGVLSWGGLLVAIAASAILILCALEVQNVRIGHLEPEQLALVLATGSVALVLLRLITGGGGIRFGFFIGLVAVGAVAYGANGAVRDAGLEIPTLSDFRPRGDG